MQGLLGKWVRKSRGDGRTEGENHIGMGEGRMQQLDGEGECHS